MLRSVKTASTNLNFPWSAVLPEFRRNAFGRIPMGESVRQLLNSLETICFEAFLFEDFLKVRLIM
jgi:hypothetical protein